MMERWAGVLLVVLCASLGTAGALSASQGHPAPRYTLDLDKDPLDRWANIVVDFKPAIQLLLAEFEKMVPKAVVEAASLIGDAAIKYLPYPYGLEIVGVATAIDRSVGDVLLANILYEVSAYGHGKLNERACTSIVAESLNGTILHGRNLDYHFTDALQNLTIIVDFYKSGKRLYTGTMFAGMVGLLTGMKPNGFTVTLNERDTGDWWMNALAAITAGTHGISTLLIRDAISDPNLDFEGAVNRLAYTNIIAPCYLIVGGVGPNQGAIITRDRESALDVWRLDSINGFWFRVETNYDHWNAPPTSDDRRDPANKAMSAMGRNNLSPTELFNVLSIHPVYNSGTVYTVLMSAADPDLYQTLVRPDPEL